MYLSQFSSLSSLSQALPLQMATSVIPSAFAPTPNTIPALRSLGSQNMPFSSQSNSSYLYKRDDYTSHLAKRDEVCSRLSNGAPLYNCPGGYHCVGAFKCEKNSSPWRNWAIGAGLAVLAVVFGIFFWRWWRGRQNEAEATTTTSTVWLAPQQQQPLYPQPH